MVSQPKWSTEDRKAILVSVFLRSGGFCTLGHNPCAGSWQVNSKTVCAYGTPCDKPTNELCRFQFISDNVNKPFRKCKAHTVQFASWHCAYGAQLPCYAPFDCHYELASDRLIKDWQAEDRERARIERKAEAKALHSLGEPKTPIRGRFNNISRDIFASDQPLYYLESIGISGLTLKPFAKVKLGSSYMRLYVDLGDSLRKVSKNRKRKAIRYGKPLPVSVDNAIALKVGKAVQDYLK